MKQENILKNRTKFFILKVKKDLVLETFGNKKTQNIESGQKLKDIFNKKNYKKLKKSKHQNKKTFHIKWKKRKYEIYFEKNTYYFYDITLYCKVQSRLEKSLKELRSKKEELQAVFDLAANGISILDRNGMFLYANKFFQNMMEYSMEELYKESCISLSSPEYSAPSQTAVEKAIQYGSIEKFKKICITKSGQRINASMSLSYLESRDEIVMITSDITDEIEYQDKLEKQIELEVSKRTKQYEIMCHQSRLAAMGEMIDSIAHQWRQPLNSLGIIVQSLRHISSQKNIDNTLLQEIESDIMNKINYMSQTIDDFSTFFRINKDKEQFDILISIEDAIRLILVQLNNHNIKIEIEKKDIRNFEIFGFSNEFRQVILNLIHNAMMQIVSKNIVDGKIKIEIKDINNNIQIDVIDNAEGVKKEDMPKIFDPYFSTKEKGSGIGLYMSKVIIENHMNGILKVRNIKDGAKFTIMLAKE